MAPSTPVLGSFRDPSGFVFLREGHIYRQVNQSYREHYDRCIASGLFDSLVRDRLLIPHREIGLEHARTAAAYKVIQPEVVPFVSYPYEWSFSQLKDAALVTLALQKRAFAHGMSLKDASAYNIQFVDGRPLLIDTLSFESYRPGQVWAPYRQFCQHFLAPLALMAQRDVRLGKLLRIHLDGIPLDLASSLLPARSKLSFGLLTHLHLHARAQVRYANRAVKPRQGMGTTAFRGLIDSLETTVRRLKWEPRGTEWADYYGGTNYGEAGLEDKRAIVAEFVQRVRPASVWDLGANTGLFSRVCAARGARTVAFDVDPGCVERNYLECKRDGEKRMLPLLLDLTNPSPGIGWAHEERLSLMSRGPVDAVLALALIHHLAIANNLPLRDIARILSRMGRSLVVEFVPKQDSQVQRLLATREDVFPNYTQADFEADFGAYFEILDAKQPAGTLRTVYLMNQRRAAG